MQCVSPCLLAPGDHVPAHPDVVRGEDRGEVCPHCVPAQHCPQLGSGMGEVAGRGGTVRRESVTCHVTCHCSLSSVSCHLSLTLLL